MLLDGAFHGDGYHVEAKHAIELIGRELVLEAIRGVDRRRAIVSPGNVGGDLFEHRAQLDAILAQRDFVRLGDAGIEILHVDDLGLSEPALERIVVEPCGARSDRARGDLGLRSLPGPIRIGHTPLTAFEDQRGRVAVIGGAQHAGVEQDHTAVKTAVDPAVLGGRVALHNTRNPERMQRRLQVGDFGQRITQRLGAQPDRPIKREHALRLQVEQGFRLLLRPLAGHRIRPLVKGRRTHDLQVLLETRPGPQVLREVGMHALVRAVEAELRDHGRQPAMHERAVVDDEQEGQREQPRTVAARRREGFTVCKVAARKLRVEILTHGRGLLGGDERPGLLAQRIVFLTGEGCEFLRRHVAQIPDDVHDLVIAEHDMYGAARLSRLGLEAHEQIEHLAGIRTAIEEIAGVHQVRVAGFPMQRIIDHRRFAQHRQQLVIRTVHVREGNDALRTGDPRFGSRPGDGGNGEEQCDDAGRGTSEPDGCRRRECCFAARHEAYHHPWA